MSHGYPGNPVYPASITIPDDGDLDAAAAYAVAFEQLTDRTEALRGGGVGGSFTNATFHGTTTFADGAMSAPGITTIDLEAGDVAIRSTTGTIEIEALGTGPITINSSSAIFLNAGTFVQMFGGKVEISGSLVSIGDAVTPFAIFASGLSVTATTIDIPGTTTISLPNTATINSSAELWQSGFTSLDGVVCYHSVNRAVGDSSGVAGNTSVFEYILPDPGLITSILLDHTGAQLGQRVRFNAQQATGPNHWALGYAGKVWLLRNAAGATVIVEFVSNGLSWIVDDWEPGGVALRNG